MKVQPTGLSAREACSLPSEINSIARLLEYQAKHRPSAAAILMPGGASIDYETLWCRVRALSFSLHARGMTARSRLAIVMPNGPDMAVTLLGVSSICTALPLNPKSTRDEFAQYLKLLQADGVIVGGDDDIPARAAANEVGVSVFDVCPDEQSDCDADVKYAGGDDVAMVLLTSGSTGSPKRVPLTHANIFASVRDIVTSLKLTDKDCALCMWEQFHIGGLVDLLLAPLAAGGSVLVGPGFGVREFFELLEIRRPTWFQAVPASLHEINNDAQQRGIKRVDSPLRFIRSVAAALPPATRERISELFHVPVVQTFGMTEASPLITSTPLPPESAKDGSVGKAITTEVAIVNDQGDQLPSGSIGEVVIRGPNIMSGYENDLEANRDAFLNGWFRTGDIGCLDSDGELFLKGRSRELINRGGEKVWPVEIDEILIQHPAITQAAAFPIFHRVLGEDVAVAVVCRPDAPLSAMDVRRFLAERLSSFKVPRRVFFMDALPRGPTGKVKRHELSTMYLHSCVKDDIAPESITEHKLAGIWSEILQLPRVGVEDDFFDLGGDSLSGMRLLAAIEKEFGVRLAENILFQLSTIRNLVPLLNKPDIDLTSHSGDDPVATAVMAALAGSGLTRTGRGGLLIGRSNPKMQPPLFWCFNSPLIEWSALSAALGERIPVLGMFSGGTLLDFAHDVHESLADLYFKAVEEMWPEGPLYLGGNCRGAAVMARVARRFVDSGRIPERLILMEYFEPEVFQYPGRMLLLYGKQSEMRAHLAFRWGRPHWREQFARVPLVDWLDGAHGQFFRKNLIAGLADKITLFVDSQDARIKSGQNLRDRILTWIHARPKLFDAYVKWHRRNRARMEGRM